MTYLSCHEVESIGALKDTYYYEVAIQSGNSRSSYKIDVSTE